MKTSLNLFALMCVISIATARADTVEALDVAPVWAGHRVGFCLLTRPPYQFVAYYDAERHMTVASRKLDKQRWRYTVLPERIGWDSHNYITMVADDDGFLHLSGNMHVHPLKYFRTRKPLDVSTFERIPQMVGSEERRTTYPRFFRGPDNQLIFTYRDGSSGSGNQIYNVYGLKSQTWRRLLDRPLTDGEGKMNAYLSGPSRGPDGYWHVVWVWRDTPDCATNHDPTYARSKDLVHWETSQGAPLELPITLATGDVVDPVPAGGGAINGNVKLGFDLQQRPVVAYIKYDANGNTQLYNARLENGQWNIYQSTQWDHRWEFQGGGTIHFEVRIQPVRVQGETLVQSWSHDRYGSRQWRLDPETLQPVERLEIPKSTMPTGIRKVEGGFPGLQTHFRNDSGHTNEPRVRYMLRWEALGSNRDRPRKKPWPEPSMLRVYRIEAE